MMDHNKYDRQLRLWSASGQDALGESHVLVTGISLATLEAAKGLVLAGIGSLTIVPGPESAMTEFSLFSSDKNELLEQLRSLNEEANVVAVTRLDEIASKVTLVIHSPFSEYSVPQLAAKFNAPVLDVGSYLLKGYVRMSASALFVLQPHPEAGLADLRISKASLDQWPELRDFCNSFNLDELSDPDHAHVPYYVLLAKVHRAGMGVRDLKEVLARTARSSLEENFEEAIRNARLAVKAETDVPTGALELVKFYTEHKFNDPSPFWQLVHALGTFIENHGVLPVSGEVPDMISSTENFVALKRIYAARFDQDAATLASYLPATAQIPAGLVHIFCRNCRVLKYIYRNESRAPQLQETEKLCREHTNREIYAVASLVGGVATQEATKIIMHQYMPVLGVLVYDAASGELVVKDADQYNVIDVEKA